MYKVSAIKQLECMKGIAGEWISVLNFSLSHIWTISSIWPTIGMQEMIPKSGNSILDTQYTWSLPFFSTKRISFNLIPFFIIQHIYFPRLYKEIRSTITWDFEGACWATFFDPFATPWWIVRSARMLSNDHNAKDTNASKDRRFNQSTDVL